MILITLAPLKNEYKMSGTKNLTDFFSNSGKFAQFPPQVPRTTNIPDQGNYQMAQLKIIDPNQQ